MSWGGSENGVETNGSFQNHPNSLEIVITWRYHKPFYIALIQIFFQSFNAVLNCHSIL